MVRDEKAEVIRDLSVCLEYDGYSEGIRELVALIEEGIKRVADRIRSEADLQPVPFDDDN